MTQTMTTFSPKDMEEFARQARVRILEAVKHASPLLRDTERPPR